jgi:hypothetical protein
MAINRVADIRTQLLKAVALRKDRLTQSPCRITTLNSVLNQEYYLVHIYSSQHPANVDEHFFAWDRFHLTGPHFVAPANGFTSPRLQNFAVIRNFQNSQPASPQAPPTKKPEDAALQ